MLNTAYGRGLNGGGGGGNAAGNIAQIDLACLFAALPNAASDVVYQTFSSDNERLSLDDSHVSLSKNGILIDQTSDTILFPDRNSLWEIEFVVQVFNGTTSSRGNWELTGETGGFYRRSTHFAADATGSDNFQTVVISYLGEIPANEVMFLSSGNHGDGTSSTDDDFQIFDYHVKINELPNTSALIFGGQTTSFNSQRRIGEFFYAKSGRSEMGVIAVTPGIVVGGAMANPIWAGMYPEFVVGDDIVFPADVEGMFMRNLGGLAATEGQFQTDRTARNGLNGNVVSVGSTGNNRRAGGSLGAVRNSQSRTLNINSTDPETSPANRAYQLYAIVDSY